MSSADVGFCLSANHLPRQWQSIRNNRTEKIMASYTVIGGDTKEYGPIWQEDVLRWIAEGRLNAQSLAKSETDKAWRTLASFPEFADAFKTTTPTASYTGPANPNWEAEVLAREPELRLGECFVAGMSFVGANFGFLFGAVLLTWITNLPFAIMAVTVPLLGPLLMACFYGVIMGGFYIACVRRMRGEAVAPTEVFCGFKTAFGQLLLTGLVSMLLIQISACFLLLPAIYLMVAWMFALPLVVDKQMQFWPALELSRKVVTRVWFEALILLFIAFLPVALFQIFNIGHTVMYFLNLYDQANHDFQQFAQLLQSQAAEIKKATLKMTFIGQGVLLLNLFFVGGVLMRAYENLFGPKKS